MGAFSADEPQAVLGFEIEALSKPFKFFKNRKKPLRVPKFLLEVTFNKLMPLRANTAKALNSTPIPSSRVKTMLVLKEKQQFLLLSSRREINIWLDKREIYLMGPLASWDYWFPCKYQKTGNNMSVILGSRILKPNQAKDFNELR